MRRDERGQSLIELLVGITIVMIIVGSAVTALVVSLRINKQTANDAVASKLAQELLDDVRSVAEGDWNMIYGTSNKEALPTGSHYLVATGTPTMTLVVMPGSEDVVRNGITFTRTFSIENVLRDADGNIATTSATEDPSTQKITAGIAWGTISDFNSVRITEYITRSTRNEVIRFTDWSGASSTAGPILEPDGNYSSASSVNNGAGGRLSL